MLRFRYIRIIILSGFLLLRETKIQKVAVADSLRHNQTKELEVTIMSSSRKTSAGVAKVASHVLRTPSTSKPVRKVAASALSQRAPQPKRGKK
jgi:hypothetical protein